MLRLKRKKAQSTAEYVIVLGLIVAAVMAMQTYIKRGFQGRIRNAVDYVDNGPATGTQPQMFNGTQYEPYYLSSSFGTDRTSTETEGLGEGGTATRGSTESTHRQGNQTISSTSQPRP